MVEVIASGTTFVEFERPGIELPLPVPTDVPEGVRVHVMLAESSEAFGQFSVTLVERNQPPNMLAGMQLDCPAFARGIEHLLAPGKKYSLIAKCYREDGPAIITLRWCWSRPPDPTLLVNILQEGQKK